MCQTFISREEHDFEKLQVKCSPLCHVTLRPPPTSSSDFSVFFSVFPEVSRGLWELFRVVFSSSPLFYFALSLSLLSHIRVSLNEVFNLRRSRCLKSAEWEETAFQNLFCVWSLSPSLEWMNIFESDNVSEKMWIGSFYTSCSNSFISCLSNYFFLERDFVLFCYS